MDEVYKLGYGEIRLRHICCCPHMVLKNSKRKEKGKSDKQQFSAKNISVASFIGFLLTYDTAGKTMSQKEIFVR